MKVLINISPDEAKHLPALDYLLRQRGVRGMSTTRTLSKADLVALAQKTSANAILLIHEGTLARLVDDPKPTLDNWRGSRLHALVPILVMDKLVNLYAKAEGKLLAEYDLDKLKSIHKPIRKIKPIILRTVYTFKEAMEAANNAVIMGVDIETNQWAKKIKSSKKPLHDPDTLDIADLGESWITCVAFSMMCQAGKVQTFVLPLVNGMTDYWKDDNEYAHALSLLRTLMRTDCAKVFHNGLYDAYHLIRYHAWPRNWCLDTMALSWAWYSEMPKTLAHLSSWLLYDHSYWKYLADSEHKVGKSIEDYWFYNGSDAEITLRCAVELLKRGPQWMLPNYKMQFPLVYPSLYGAFEGFKMNNTTRRRLLTEATERLEKARRVLQVMTDDPDFNPSSSQQNSEFMYNVLGAMRPPRAKTASAAGKKERTFVAAQHPWLSLFVDTLNNYTKDAKAVSTYFQFLQWHGRLLWSADPFGTETSRFASRKSAAWVGTQIQNQPYYAKEMYEPDTGYLGFEIDFSKAEAICTAYLAKCEKLIQALCFPELDANGKKKDFYKVLGVLFFKMAYEDVTDFFRNKVLKKIQHGTNYMMGANTFIDNLEDITILYTAAEVLGYTITPKPKAANEVTMKTFVEILLESYHIPFPEIKQLWNSIKDTVAATGMLTNPCGFTRVFFGDPTKNHAVHRSAVAHYSQSTSVNCLNAGYLRVYKLATRLPDPAALRLKTQIHDSLKGQVKIEYAAQLIPLLSDLLEARQDIHGRLMVILCEVEVYHTNWKEKKSWKAFSETILPTLGTQKSLTFSTDGLR